MRVWRKRENKDNAAENMQKLDPRYYLTFAHWRKCVDSLKSIYEMS